MGPGHVQRICWTLPGSCHSCPGRGGSCSPGPLHICRGERWGRGNASGLGQGRTRSPTGPSLDLERVSEASSRAGAQDVTSGTEAGRHRLVPETGESSSCGAGAAGERAVLLTDIGPRSPRAKSWPKALGVRVGEGLSEGRPGAVAGGPRSGDGHGATCGQLSQCRGPLSQAERSQFKGHCWTLLSSGGPRVKGPPPDAALCQDRPLHPRLRLSNEPMRQTTHSPHTHTPSTPHMKH